MISIVNPISLKFGRRLAGMVLSFSFVATAALAAPALNEEKHINDSLIAAAIGDLVRRNCATISPRYFVVLSKANALERYAMGLGFSKKEIKAFMKNDTERKRVRAAAESYLADQGVVKGQESTYCAAGRKEIANKTLTGQLLRGR